jgi:large subunit ribosomal protein L30e
VDLKKAIKDALIEENIIIGYNRVIKALKTGNPKMVIHANNISKNRLENILHNSKIKKIEVKEYPNDNVNLGLICGKPFSVSVLAIEGKEK